MWRYFRALCGKSLHGALRLEACEAVAAILCYSAGFFFHGAHENMTRVAFVILLAFGVTVLVGLFLAAYRMDEAKSKLIATQTAGKEQFQQSIIVFRAEAHPVFQANGQDSHLLFHFWLFNGSLFPFYIKSVTGHVRFTNYDVAGQTELIGDAQDIPYGTSHRFSLRQWITPESVKLITGMTNGGARSEFAFDAVNVKVALRDGNNEKRLDLPVLSAQRPQWEIKWQ